MTHCAEYLCKIYKPWYGKLPSRLMKLPPFNVLLSLFMLHPVSHSVHRMGGPLLVSALSRLTLPVMGDRPACSLVYPSPPPPHLSSRPHAPLIRASCVTRHALLSTVSRDVSCEGDTGDWWRHIFQRTSSCTIRSRNLLMYFSSLLC